MRRVAALAGAQFGQVDFFVATFVNVMFYSNGVCLVPQRANVRGIAARLEAKTGVASPRMLPQQATPFASSETSVSTSADAAAVVTKPSATSIPTHPDSADRLGALKPTVVASEGTADPLPAALKPLQPLDKLRLGSGQTPRASAHTTPSFTARMDLRACCHEALDRM